MDPSYDELLTGLASIKINSITGDPTESGAAAPWAFTAEATLTQLTELSYGQTRVLDGAINIAISSPGPVAPHVEIDNVSFTVPSMRIQHNGDTHEYRGYEGTLVQDIGIHGLTYAATVSGAIISTVLGGRIDVKTMTAFGGAAPVEEPTTGRALITGASGHTIDLQPAAKGVVNLLLTTPASSTAQAIVTSWTTLEQ